MQELKVIELNEPDLIELASRLTHTGRIAVSDDNLSYLNIDDNFIHYLQPLLEDDTTQEPDYFDHSTNYIGAHISVIYPEEGIIIEPKDLNTVHYFTVTGLFMAECGQKIYYALRVNSPSLLKLRHKYGLQDKLQLQNHLLDLHITVGIKSIAS
jgi:hypothetical protein